MRKLSPTFIAAGIIVSVSLFVLLSMLFYGPTAHTELSAQLAQQDPLRFHVAHLFFGTFGVGAYVGWMVILAWAIVVFFRESAGDLALRGISLVVAVVSGAALFDLLGSHHLGGSLGYAIGTVLEANFGSGLGVVLMGGIFLVSVALATDFGFISYYREARGALAVSEKKVQTIGFEAEPEPEPDLIARLDRTAELLEEEEKKAPEEAASETPDDPEAEAEARPIVVTMRPPIEEENLDEDLLKSDAPPREEAEAAAAEVEAEEEPPAAELEAPAELEQSAEPEDLAESEESELVEVDLPPTATVAEEAPRAESDGEAAERMAALESVFDALVGPTNGKSSRPTSELAAEESSPLSAVPAADVMAQPTPVTHAVDLLDAEVDTTEEFVVGDHIALIEDDVLEEEEEEEEVSESAAAPEGTIESEGEVDLEDTGEFEILSESEPEVAVEVLEPVPVVEPVPEAETVVVETEEEEAEDESPLLPFMEEEQAEAAAEEPEPAVETALAPPPEREEVTEPEELPVLEDVGEKTKPRGLRGLFRRKKEAARADDPLLGPAAELVFERGKASVVLLQRRLDIGYTRASRLVEAMERQGLVGPLLESGSREVRMTQEEWEESRA